MWKILMFELGKEAKIPDFWCVSALSEICPEMMRLDEIGENYENLKAKVVFYTFNKAEQTLGGHKEMYVPIGCRSRQWQ